MLNVSFKLLYFVVFCYFSDLEGYQFILGCIVYSFFILGFIEI